MNALQDPIEPASTVADLRLSSAAADQIRIEVEKAGGREVCFLADVGPDRVLIEPRAVARGNKEAVLAAARDADEGSVMIHNHPSGVMEASGPDMQLAQLYGDDGIGVVIVDNDVKKALWVVEPRVRRVARLDPDEVRQFFEENIREFDKVSPSCANESVISDLLLRKK